ncbi:hypothetical protein SAMN02799630_02851 [Paenibacillus sp. UNCCL117]|uniref:hypothetical protein n=1 Tax=unclassified Paenibacillus TaxID=185978 RepID=UPI00088D2EE5|nr:MULTISPECIES: hypothetical protein [unclassified Paenibacillus]SDD28030.1 hypothetical protein SAMN04488602_107140 [Paenibacillus sp. cl123]SFW40979.1 hypothetical protein SAMN02799630_02851 [Paenibacillus sp. UNCCL117]
MTYTVEQIRQQPAGEQLDARLASAFGWEHYFAKTGIVVKRQDGKTFHAHLSTTWSGMELVVEEMRAEYSLELSVPGKRYGDRWAARFGIYSEHAFAETAPHAVAIAALLALKGETA